MGAAEATGAPSVFGGLRVLEVANDPAGEMTGLQLAHLGADVVKVEPPSGAPSRSTGPFAGGEPAADRSLPHWYYNRNKRSVVLDLADAESRGRFDKLLESTDVVIITLAPPELRAAGIDLAQLSSAHPSLIIASVTPFGLTGPWADYRSSDLVGLAASGLLVMSGYDDKELPPIRPGGDQGFHTAASFAVIAISLALLQRQRSGAGSVLDVSMHEAAGVSPEIANPYWFYPRVRVRRQTCRSAQPVPTQPAIFQCNDDRWIYFSLILADPKPWKALVDWMRDEDLAADLVDEAYDQLAHRQENFGHIQELVEVFFLLRDSTSAYHDGQKRGLPIGVINAPEELFDDEQLTSRGLFVEIEQPGYGPAVLPRSPYRLSGYAVPSERPAAGLGEHTEEILGPLASAGPAAGTVKADPEPPVKVKEDSVVGGAG